MPTRKKLKLHQVIVQCPDCTTVETLEFFKDKLDSETYIYIDGKRVRKLGKFYQFDGEVYHNSPTCHRPVVKFNEGV